MNRHAYLIMAHNHIENLQALLSAIDDERNAVFLHIDKKSLNKENWDALSMSHASFYRVPSMEVNWAGYSQVACTLRLMEHAVKHGPYQYYHLLTGASFPLKSQDQIHDFFDQRDGKIFLNFQKDGGNLFYSRVRYFRPSIEHQIHPGQPYSSFQKHLADFTDFVIRIQDRFHYDRFKRFNLVHQKGLAYWSLPHPCILYLLEHKKQIHSVFKYCVSADESFVQTMIYNSPMKEHIDHDTDGLVSTTWELEDNHQVRKNHAFIQEDLDYLLSGNTCFALKFVGQEGLELTDAIAASFQTQDASGSRK